MILVMSTQRSDEELAKRFIDGDESAFEQLVTRYAKAVYNFALNFLGDPDEADEAAQLTFVQLFQALPRARLDWPLKPWIYQIARNKCIDLWRSHKGVLSLTAHDEPSGGEAVDPLDVDPADPAPLPEELAERQDLQRILRQAINALPLNYRTAATLRYVNELSFVEIARAMGIPENTAKTYFQRAKAILRKRLARSL
jgi:RNA polymerase sigma factor (sigma-70 family)